MTKKVSSKKKPKKPEKKVEKKWRKLFKKPFIYFTVVIILLAACSGTLFVYFLNKSNIKTTWGETYYGFLRERLKDDSNEDVGIIDGTESDMRFLEVEGQDDPVLAVTHGKETNNPRTNVYYIQNNTVNTVVYTQTTQVVFLYNISIQKYDYYLHVASEGKDIYKSIAALINEQSQGEHETKTIKSDPEYVFKKNDVEKVVDENGEEISVSEFDKTFIKPDVPDNSVPLRTDMSDDELRNAVASTEDQYQPKEEIVNEEVKAEVENDIKAVEERAKKVETIKEEQTLTNSNVAKKLEENFKWIYGFELGSLFGMPTVYKTESKDPSFCQKIGLPKNKFDGTYNCREFIGAGSIANMKTTALKYLDASVYRKLNGDKVLNDSIYDKNGKVYFVFHGGGVGGANLPYYSVKTAKVASCNSGTCKVSWTIPRDTSVVVGGSEYYKKYELVVKYRNGNFVVTDLKTLSSK